MSNGRRWICAAAAAVAACVPATASAGVSVGHSGWEWGNPLPQGNTLSAVEFIGARGYAAGAFGTVLRSDDAGATWRGIPTGVTASLTRIRMVGTDTLIAGGGCVLRRSDNAGESFRRLPWTPRDTSCPSPIASLAFPSGDVGYLLLADGSVRRSADGGARWSVRTALPGTPAARGGQDARDILFTSADVGFAAIGAPGQGTVLRTTDGGGSWTPVVTSPEPVNGLWFVDPATGYAVGNGGTVFKTTDGGATWAPVPVTAGNFPLDLRSIRCADANTCIATKFSGDQVFRTTDGGATWTPVSPSTEPIYAAALATATRAVAVGASGVTVVSDDAGATWARVGTQLPNSDALHSLTATSGDVAFGFGRGGALARTLDAGQTWSSIAAPTSDDLRDVSFPNINVGFALDTAGTLFRSDDGGGSWSILDTGTSRAPRSVVALDDVTVLLIGPEGIRRSTDGGASFARISDRVVRRARVSEADVAAGTIFAYGGKFLAASVNGGRSWRSVRRPTRGRVVQYDWISRRFGYALDAGGRVYQTRNGGRRWQEITTMGTTAVSRIAFGSLSEGYAIVEAFGEDDTSGHVLRTIDGGRTWRPQLVSEGTLRDIVASGRGVDFGLSFAGGLFVARGGGSQGADSRLTLAPRRSRRSNRPRRNRRRATIQISGRLRPAEGGEQIVVSARRGRRISRQVVTAASNGSFTTTWTISGRTLFVAQWAGDDDRRGDGSRALVLAPR